jgi:hypothetical protein
MYLFFFSIITYNLVCINADYIGLQIRSLDTNYDFYGNGGSVSSSSLPQFHSGDIIYVNFFYHPDPDQNLRNYTFVDQVRVTVESITQKSNTDSADIANSEPMICGPNYQTTDKDTVNYVNFWCPLSPLNVSIPIPQNVGGVYIFNATYGKYSMLVHIDVTTLEQSSSNGYKNNTGNNAAKNATVHNGMKGFWMMGVLVYIVFLFL